VKNPTVLLILEESKDLEAYGSFLHDQGYETLRCTSPGEGINTLETNAVSLVIVSQDTPSFEGRLVLERSLRLRPDVPVLVVARVLNIHSYLEVMELGATDYLERPEPRDLAWVVETQMRRATAPALIAGKC
jgi:DNA-binding response OmpR family regulator